MKRQFQDQAALLVAAIPHVAQESCFALKGGTAINLFLRPMPRLSVDIDLAYLGFEPREDACQAINRALDRISSKLGKAGFSTVIQGSSEGKKIIVSDSNATIKIEPNYTLRGHVYQPEARDVCKSVEDLYGFARMSIISGAELYGGKMCAALDRQHPRDLFDIDRLLNGDEHVPFLMHGFITMLLSHNRPPQELLIPKIKDQRDVFKKEFIGMTDEPFSYADHEKALQDLLSFIRERLSPFRETLLWFFTLGDRPYNTGIPNLDRLPAIQWKRKNLKRLKDSDARKFHEQTVMLTDFLKTIKE